MKKVVISITVGLILLLTSGEGTPLAAQCMGCVSSSQCSESSARGACKVTCTGTLCTCSDTLCKPQITVAPTGAEYYSQLATYEGVGEPDSEAIGVLVRDCEGEITLLMYSADGMLHVDWRLAARPSEHQMPIRVAGLDLR